MHQSLLYKKMVNYLTNSSWHQGPYGSLWTGMSPTKYYMDRSEDVTHKILYGPKRSWGPYTILWVTDRSINCHLVQSAMNYLLGTDHLTWRGGYGFLLRSEIFFWTTQEIEYLFFFCCAMHKFFFQSLTLGYMTKTLNQIIFFFPPQNQNIFLKKKHNPPPPSS